MGAESSTDSPLLQRSRLTYDQRRRIAGGLTDVGRSSVVFNGELQIMPTLKPRYRGTPDYARVMAELVGATGSSPAEGCRMQPALTGEEPGQRGSAR